MVVRKARHQEHKGTGHTSTVRNLGGVDTGSGNAKHAFCSSVS